MYMYTYGDGERQGEDRKMDIHHSSPLNSQSKHIAQTRQLGIEYFRMFANTLSFSNQGL